MFVFQALLVLDEPDLKDIFLPDSDFLAVDLEAVARLERVAVLLRRTVEVDLCVFVLVLAVGLELVLVLAVAAVALSEDVEELAVLLELAFAELFASVDALAFPEASVLPIVELLAAEPLFQ